MADNPKLTPKQEAFALAFFETGSAIEAYRRAYDVAEGAKDNWIYVEAYQLADHPKITIYLEGLREQARRLSIYTRQQALEEFEDARVDAKKLGNPSAAVAAINGKVKLFGLEAPTKAKVDHTSSDGTMTPVSAADILGARLDAIAGRTTGEPKPE